MNAIKSVFEALYSQKIAKKDHEFCHIFDLCLNLHHKNPILKNSKKALHYMARLVTWKTKWPYGSNPSFKTGPNPRSSEVFEKWII